MSDFSAAEHYINRELSLLQFNHRVLEQAVDPANPLLERLKFLCIASSNVDEFFEVRVAALQEQIRFGAAVTGPEGLSPRQAYKLVSTEAHRLVERQYRVLNDVLLPELAEEGVRFLRRSDWSEAQQEWIRDYFFRELAPVLTPIGLDPSHPFPRVLNKSLNFAVELEGKDAFGRNSGTAVVQAPRSLSRVIRLAPEVSACEYDFVFLSSILHAHVAELFAGMQVRGCYQFRVTRNSDLFVDEEEISNLRIALQGELPHRNYGEAVRLEVAEICPDGMASFLLGQFNLERDGLFRVNGPVNLVRLMQVPGWVDRPDLKFKPFLPGVAEEFTGQEDIFAVIRQNDILLHHPYQSFNPVVDFIKQAATDPDVMAIKQTVYRTSADSALMQALITAAQDGKEVTAVVELMARFDEEANINWAKRLEDAGVHVVYGVVGHKTHAKMAMVVRREAQGLCRYVHLGTGNYHPSTAKLYTDFGLLTCREDLCADVHEVFLQLTGLGRATKLTHVWQSPFTLHANLMKAIEEEAACARAGGKAVIIAKMNALLEPGIIQALYAASAAGVKIHLIIRGVCALRPGVPGVSENIRVRSIVGRFLEHSRVFYFYAGGAERVYLSSADWMSRNFFRRIETCFPILDPKLKKRVIREALRASLRDNGQAWDMMPDGRYLRRSARRAKPYAVQPALLALLAKPVK